jgi:hypothetical protein
MTNSPLMTHLALPKVRIFEILLAQNGTFNTSQICEYLEISKNTALKTMLELKVAGLVDIPYEDRYNAEKQITLKTKFKWFLTKEFADLKEAWTYYKKYPPRTRDKNESESAAQPSDNQNMKHETEENGRVRGGEILLHPPNEDIEGSGSTTEELEQSSSSGRDGVTVTLQTPSSDTDAVTASDTQETETDPSLLETTRYLNNFREEAAERRLKKDD